MVQCVHFKKIFLFERIICKRHINKLQMNRGGCPYGIVATGVSNLHRHLSASASLPSSFKFTKKSLPSINCSLHATDTSHSFTRDNSVYYLPVYLTTPKTSCTCIHNVFTEYLSYIRFTVTVRLNGLL